MSERTKEFFSDIKTRLIETENDIEDAKEMITFLRETGKDVTTMQSNLSKATRDHKRMMSEVEKRV